MQSLRATNGHYKLFGIETHESGATITLRQVDEARAAE
jgi:hypothetical protein